MNVNIHASFEVKELGEKKADIRKIQTNLSYYLLWWQPL